MGIHASSFLFSHVGPFTKEEVRRVEARAQKVRGDLEVPQREVSSVQGPGRGTKQLSPSSALLPMRLKEENSIRSGEAGD